MNINTPLNAAAGSFYLHIPRVIRVADPNLPPRGGGVNSVACVQNALVQ